MAQRDMKNLVQTNKAAVFWREAFGILFSGVNRAAVGIGNRVFIGIGKIAPQREAGESRQIFDRRFQIGTHPARIGTA